jgi:hypothetical protein
MKYQLKQKQQELKEWLKKLGLSQNVFAERVFYEINESDNAIEIKQFVERFKKALNRESTDVGLIESYLKILYQQNEFLKLGLVVHKPYYEDEFSEIFNKRMKKISKNITDNIIEKDNE